MARRSRSDDRLTASYGRASSMVRASRGTNPAHKRASNAKQSLAWGKALMVSAGMY
jgi:hypothetical protein